MGGLSTDAGVIPGPEFDPDAEVISEPDRLIDVVAIYLPRYFMNQVKVNRSFSAPMGCSNATIDSPVGRASRPVTRCWAWNQGPLP